MSKIHSPKKRSFDISLFSEHVGKAMKLLDDLVDIEIESIDKIIAKVEADPESNEVKANELSLWNGVKTICQNGRRTGLGITALGDFIAMLNHKYGMMSLSRMSSVFTPFFVMRLTGSR